MLGMAHLDVLCLYVGLLLTRSTVTSAGSGDGLRRTNYGNQGFVADVGSAHAALLEYKAGVSKFDCARYFESKPTFQWFIYNSMSNMCISSTCCEIPMQPLGTSNNVFYRKDKGQLTVPQSCFDVKEINPTAADGEYWIYPSAPTFLGCPTKIYCHDMASESPSEYVSLTVTNSGEYPSVQDLYCLGDEQSIAGHVTNFSKIRVDVKVMEVDIADHTFATGIGAFGEASDCYSAANLGCGPKGTFHVNTHGTGMLVDPQQKWNQAGHESHVPLVTRSEGGVKIDLLCGGGCGQCRPDGPLKLFKNFQEVVPQERAVSVTKSSCYGH